MKRQPAVLPHIIPSRHNAYRPHLLRRSSLVFFLALILLSETALVAVQWQTTPMRAEVAAAAAAPSPTSLESRALKQISKVLNDPLHSVDWFLGAVAVALAILIAFALFFRPQIQPAHALAPAMALACMALMLIALNTVALNSTSTQTAAIEQSATPAQ